VDSGQLIVIQLAVQFGFAVTELKLIVGWVKR